MKRRPLKPYADLLPGECFCFPDTAQVFVKLEWEALPSRGGSAVQVNGDTPVEPFSPQPAYWAQFDARVRFEINRLTR